MKIKLTITALLGITFLSGCATNPANQISIHEAVKASVDALEYAYKSKQLNGGSWGLAPSEITLVYTISDQRNKNKEVSVTGSIGAAPSFMGSFGGKFSKSETTQQGNVITMKFTQGGH